MLTYVYFIFITLVGVWGWRRELKDGNYYQNYDGNYYQNYDGNYNPNYTKEYNDLTIKEMLTLILIMLFVFALIANQYVKICFRKDRHNNNYTNIMRLTQQKQ